MRSTMFRAVAAVIALGAFSASVFTSHFGFLLLAMLALLLLATSLSTAGSLTQPLQRFRRQVVEVRVWGAPLPIPNGAALTLTSVRALGAGLHIFLQVGPGESASHLKIAQPGRTRFEPRNVVIESAAYVQWSGKRLPRVTGAPAVTVALGPSSFPEPPESVA